LVFCRLPRKRGRRIERFASRKFTAGRYNPVIPFPLFPISPNSPGPGPQHASAEEALNSADADGTRSIVDIFFISDTAQLFAATPLGSEKLMELYGTATPSKKQIERNMTFMDSVARGHCVYFTVYKDGLPSEIFFGGYSFD
jgi:hypothetical protein